MKVYFAKHENAPYTHAIVAEHDQEAIKLAFEEDVKEEPILREELSIDDYIAYVAPKDFQYMNGNKKGLVDIKNENFSCNSCEKWTREKEICEC